MQENKTKLYGQLRHHWRQNEPGFERTDCVLAALKREQERAELAKDRGKARVAFRRPPKTGQCVFQAASLPQRYGQCSIDLGIGLAANGRFEWRDCLRAAALGHEREAEYLKGARVTRFHPQDLAREALGVLRLLIIQGQAGAIQHLVAA
jgi:hypothetical protein